MKGFFKAGKTIWIIAYAEHASHRFHRTHALRQSVSHTIQPFTTSFAFPKQTHITKPKHTMQLWMYPGQWITWQEDQIIGEVNQLHLISSYVQNQFPL